MATNEIKNVLVLGTTDVNISQFAKLFGAYLQYDSYEEAIKWEPDLATNEIDEEKLLVGNLNLICTPNLNDASATEQIITVLANFTQKQSLHAIVILLKLEDNRVYLDKLKSSLFCEFSGNILYVFALEADSYQHQQCLMLQVDVFEARLHEQRENLFYFKEDAFYKIATATWQSNIEFSKGIFDCIQNKNKGYYIAITPVKSLLKLTEDLLELLIQIYICIKTTIKSQDYLIFVSDYKRNITVCYGNQCSEWKEVTEDSKSKTPRICHVFCNCNCAKVANCMIFKSPSRTCSQCNCNVNSHSENYFKLDFVEGDYRIHVVNERSNTINIFATFFLYKKQHQEVYHFENIFHRLLDMKEEPSKKIFDDFKKDFGEELRKLSPKPIIGKDILGCLKNLFEITESASIIPVFLDEIFPKDFKLESVIEQNKPKEMQVMTISPNIVMNQNNATNQHEDKEQNKARHQNEANEQIKATNQNEAKEHQIEAKEQSEVKTQSEATDQSKVTNQNEVICLLNTVDKENLKNRLNELSESDFSILITTLMDVLKTRKLESEEKTKNVVSNVKQIQKKEINWNILPFHDCY